MTGPGGALIATILFIPLSAAQFNLEADWAEAGMQVILRHCPICAQDSIVGHARAAGLPAIQQALAAARHLLEMHRRCLTDEKTRRQFHLLDRRLRAVADQLAHIATAGK
jgi:hypothetical protein